MPKILITLTLQGLVLFGGILFFTAIPLSLPPLELTTVVLSGVVVVICGLIVATAGTDLRKELAQELAKRDKKMDEYK